jgi:hypothetical protein
MRLRPDIVFKSLADPTGRAIRDRLMRVGEQTVGTRDELLRAFWSDRFARLDSLLTRMDQ